MKVGVLTAGGDCPGLNAVIRAVGRSALRDGNQAVGILEGYRGLAQRTYVPLDSRTVSGILALGGTILGTSSFEPHTEGAIGEVKGAFAPDSPTHAKYDYAQIQQERGDLLLRGRRRQARWSRSRAPQAVCLPSVGGAVVGGV